MNEDDILKTEYSETFDKLRKNRMETSYHKYGPISKNYGEHLINAITNLKKRLQLYEDTGNTEYLCDVANFAMIEFMYPQHQDAHFDNISKSPGLNGINFRDIERL